MEIKKVTDPSFRKYGRVVEGIDFTELVKAINEKTPLPEGVAYEPSIRELEATQTAKDLQKKTYGELPIEVGYCNGHNYKLNAVEYHRNSEINVAATDAILILGMQQDITDDFQYDTAKMEAFLVEAGTAVEIYATTLHYAPCSANDGGFKVGIVLPAGTNYPLKEKHEGWEDALITAQNKWLIGHAEGGLDAGAHIGLIGKNLDIRE
ncbi:MAG: DUF4867 family protein [Bacteroidales bacterium]|nr:DUF4867 family protein [Bacteroidales bacterium]MCM1416244.1 DUF4867 family protein [bacterium]MCM1423138.1 DUF4867 family protein [bacterium]